MCLHSVVCIVCAAKELPERLQQLLAGELLCVAGHACLSCCTALHLTQSHSCFALTFKTLNKAPLDLHTAFLTTALSLSYHAANPGRRVSLTDLMEQLSPMGITREQLVNAL